MTQPPPSAPSVLLLGEPGSGKTYSLASLAKSGLDLFVIITEPTGLESLLDSFAKQSIPIDRLHYHTITPMSADVSALIDMAKKINTNDYQTLAKAKAGVSKNKATQLMDFLHLFEDFTCERTGEAFGSPLTWDSSRALCVDSLSGLNAFCYDNTVGMKPTLHEGEWGVAMNAEARVIKLIASLPCYSVLTGHLVASVDSRTMARTAVPKALGSKLGPDIGADFSEVIYCRRDGDKFFWSTTEAGVALKARALRLSSTLSPTFGELVLATQTRAKAVAAPSTPSAPAASSSVSLPQ